MHLKVKLYKFAAKTLLGKDFKLAVLLTPYYSLLTFLMLL
jgi:hypothetical protein